MIYWEQMNARPVPTGPSKLLHIHWPLVLLICIVSGVGFLMLYSAAGGKLDTWARPQMIRFGLGIAVMFVVAMIHIDFWRRISLLTYVGGLGLLVAVEVMGAVGMGAQRWIDLGPLRLQPSEVMKVAIVMVLAQYYAWLPREKVSHPFWVALPLVLTAIPVALVLRQPDLGTSILMTAGAGVVMFLAGVSWWYFGTAIASVAATIWAVFASRGTDWQLLKDYQYDRIEIFLDPSIDPLGKSYNITQATIALGAGGLSGRGFMEGTQSRLGFVPEKHTDFIFTSLAEQFGFIGGITLLGLYTAIIMFCLLSAFRNRDRFGALMTGGLTATFFFFFFVNMGMVMGLLPVVGVPLPLVSYGGSAMLVLLGAFGLIQSAHVHRPRGPYG